MAKKRRVKKKPASHTKLFCDNFRFLFKESEMTMTGMRNVLERKWGYVIHLYILKELINGGYPSLEDRSMEAIANEFGSSVREMTTLDMSVDYGKYF
jgi:hypothetical protein